MRPFLIFFSLVLLSLAAPHRVFSQSADSSDLFLNAYMANEQGEQLENAGDSHKALSKYRYAASLLEQISRDDPKWQPIVVDYRKRKVSDNIARLQQQLGSAASAAAEAPGAPIEGELPQKENNPAPDLANPDQPAPPPASGAGASQVIRDQLEQLQKDLRESRQKLKSVEDEKADLAGRLDEALKQLDRTKVSETELKGQLKQAQDAYQNAVADHAAAAGTASEKVFQTRISQLQEALKNAEADRDAADEQNDEFFRRAALARQATASIAQQRDAANAHAQDLESKYAGTSKLAAKLAAANKQIAALTKEREDATQRADGLDQQLAATSKNASRLADAQKQIAALKAGEQAAAGKADDLTGKLADARKQITQLTEDRDAARKQVTAINGKLADARQEIVAVKADRDQIAAQRDQALADLGKAREAQKRVDQLLADNASLTQKLAADEKTIANFKSDSPEKDKQIAELRKQVSDTKALLASTLQDRDNVQSTLNDLQQQYDASTAQLAELKANTTLGDTEKKTLTDENGLLRGIVLRELKGQAKRDQARQVALGEMSNLKVQSDTLLQQINYLGQPVVQLTPAERALFKDPSIDIPDADETTMAITIAAPKQPAAAPDSSPSAVPDATPAKPPAPVQNSIATTDGSPASADSVPTPPAAAAAPSGTPMELANFTSPGSVESALSASPSPGTEENPEATPAPAASPAGPMVPPELMDDAHAAKESFERGEYRDAEKIYERMLTKSPNNVYILSNLGVVYFRNEKWKLAEESLRKAIAVAPEDTFSHTTLGIVYYQEKRYDDAVNSLTRALAINPRYAVAHNYLGITASRKGWQEAALKELLTAVELDPNYGDAFFNLAVVYAMQQPPNKDMARKYYKRAIDHGAEPDPGLDQLLK